MSITKMRRVTHLLFATGLFCSLLLLNGCSSQGESASKPVLGNDSSTPTGVDTSDSTSQNKEDLLKITTHEANSEQKQTPTDTVFHELQFEFSDHSRFVPNPNSISGQFDFGNNSLVLLKIPETSHRWYELISLEHKKNQWNISAVLDMPVLLEHQSKTSLYRGLFLPMSSFSTASMQFGNNKKLWAYGSDQYTIAIEKCPRESFSLPDNAQSVQVKGHEAWLVTPTQSQSYLLYFDKENTVCIGGILSKSDVQHLAETLPSATDSNFPYSE